MAKVHNMRLLPLIALLLGLLGPQAAQALPASEPAAAAEGSSLVLLPTARLRALAPLLRTTDLVLVESQPTGELRQLTVVTLVAAPPETVRDVVLNVERYPEFVRNLSFSQVTRNPDGTFDHSYDFSYTLFSFGGRHRYQALPRSERGDAAPVEIFDPDPNRNRHFRFEFYGTGGANGATVLVTYGYIGLQHSIDLVTKLLRRVPSLEHGLALMTQMTSTLSVKGRAEQLTERRGVNLPAAGGASYEFLLDRGVVALFRSRAGHLAEMTLIDRSVASPAGLVETARDAARYSEFVPTISSSSEMAPVDGVPTVSLQLSLPLISFETRYGIRATPSSVDMLGYDGDLKDSRQRWDMAPIHGRGMTAQTRLVLRTQQSLDRASLGLRQLYKLEPLFEHGVTLGLQLVLLRSVKAQAERTLASARP